MSLVGSITGQIASGRDFVRNKLGIPENKNPVPKKDFAGGLTILEYQDGKPLEKDKVLLLGNYLPQMPFTFGGEQRKTKDYYAGNPEPTVHILGPEESDLVLKGRFYSKKFKTEASRELPYELSRQLDAMRIRGNLVEISMGEWRRFGFLTNTKFDMKTKADIDYQLTFAIVSFNAPRRLQQVNDNNKYIPQEINKELIAQMAAFQAEADTTPEEMPEDISDLIRSATNDLATAVNGVTNFINGPLREIEQIEQSLNRALGLIKYAQQQVLQFKRRVGNIGLGLAALSAAGTAIGATNQSFLTNQVAQSFTIQDLLANLRRRFEALAATRPLARYRVKSGDTLQNISNRFYNTSENWEKIYEHNNLTSTNLEVGAVLEIPRV